jgi:hypothetical protein
VTSEPDILNPVTVEQAIRAISNRIANSVKVCSERYEAFATAEHTYDVAYARAYLKAEGPAFTKKYTAELATETERSTLIVADVAYRHADRLAKALTEELRAMQSVGASVRMMYAVAGRGE